MSNDKTFPELENEKFPASEVSKEEKTKRENVIKIVEDLGVRTKEGTLEPFKDNGIKVCARCETKIYKWNKSQWSDVIEDNMTQGICRNCETTDEMLIRIREIIVTLRMDLSVMAQPYYCDMKVNKINKATMEKAQRLYGLTVELSNELERMVSRRIWETMEQ